MMDRIELREKMQGIIRQEFAYVPELIPLLINKFEDRLLTFRHVSLDTPKSIYYLRASLVWDWVKPGDDIIVNAPHWTHHGERLTVKKKQSQCFYCYKKDQPNVSYRISSGSVNILPQVKGEKLLVAVGDLVTVVSDYYRPRYDRDALFTVVWKGPKYVRLVPRFPKYAVFVNEMKRVKRLGDNIHERPSPDTKSYYKESVYSMDIPLSEIAHPTQYAPQDILLIGDMGSIGF